MVVRDLQSTGLSELEPEVEQIGIVDQGLRVRIQVRLGERRRGERRQEEQQLARIAITKSRVAGLRCVARGQIQAVLRAHRDALAAARQRNVTDVIGAEGSAAVAVASRSRIALRGRDVGKRDAGRHLLGRHHVRVKGEQDVCRHRGYLVDARPSVVHRTAHPVPFVT